MHINTEKAVEVKGFSFWYRGSESPALDSLDLEVERGRFVVIMGESGAGKSTLANSLNGLIPHFVRGRYEGSVTVGGLPARDTPVSRMAREIGLVFQDFEAQLFSTNAGLEVAFGPENFGVPRPEIVLRIGDVLRTVNLEGFEGRHPATLSGGQKQRLAIGSVLAAQGDARKYIVTAASTIAPLTEVTAALYALGSPALAQPTTVSVAELATLTIDTKGVGPTDWPATISAPNPANAPCATLDLTGTTPTARLSTAPLSSLAPADESQSSSGSAPSASDPSAGDLGVGTTDVTSGSTGNNPAANGPKVTVAGGSGALVRFTDGGTLGATVFISDVGAAHPLGENTDDTIARLGWSSNDIVTIPVAWQRLIPGGATLSNAQVWAGVPTSSSTPNGTVTGTTGPTVPSASQPDAEGEAPQGAAGGEASAGARGAGVIEMDHVRFSYDPDVELISDLSLRVEPGQTAAIVGPTGAGKTTLVNLLMRFYEIDSGRIALDGVDTSTMRRRDVRARTGMVLQDPWLFQGTIRENIRYGRPGASDEDVEAAARACYVDHIVRALPEGYETVLEEDAANVSAGERQLLTIARAFIADPAVLILDEATSSVDTRTELLVQQAMAALRYGRTSFVIAHRLSTIRDADTILVMEHGDIVEQGGHAELLERGGAYARLHAAQFARAMTEHEAPPAGRR